MKYEGKFKNGEWNGKGKEYYRNGKIKFEGQFRNGKKFRIKRKKWNISITRTYKNICSKKIFIKYFNYLNNFMNLIFYY